MNRSRFQRGFTLVELMVVMGILVVLAALLFPIVGAVTRNARVTICASNEREIVSACVSYAASNNNRLPPPISAWAGANGVADFTNGVIWPFVGPSIQSRSQIVHCPADTLEQLCTYSGVDVPQPPYRNFSYSLNINMSTMPPNGTTGIRLEQVHNPAGHVMLYEEFAPNDCLCYGPGDPDDWLTGRHGGPGTIEHRAAYINTDWRADGRGNVGFFDGHVEIMSVNTYFGTTYHFGPLNQ